MIADSVYETLYVPACWMSCISVLAEDSHLLRTTHQGQAAKASPSKHVLLDIAAAQMFDKCGIISHSSCVVRA